MKQIAPVVLVVAALGLALWLQRDDESGATERKGTANTKQPETKRPETKRPETKRPETKRPETKRPETKRPETKRPETNERRGQGIKAIVENVTVKNYRKVVYRGAIDLTATIARIKRGEKYRHRNDGGVFKNRERRLPRKARGYYREYVHPTKGVRGPGPQRVVVGSGGEWYYTADHYKSFIRIDR